MAAIITKIEKQQKNKSRYSIFLNGVYTFSVMAEILTRRKLSTGQALSETEIDEIKLEDEYVRSKVQAYRILARRDHSEKELYDKLKRKDFSPKTIQSIVAELKQKHFLNDAAFAEMYARNRIIQHPEGKRQLAFELKRKGISESVIDQTIETIYSEFDEKELAQELANKKMQPLKNQPPQKVKKKVSDFLVRRGFGWDIVQQVFDELNFDDGF